MKKLLTIFITSLLIGCSSSDSSDDTPEPQDNTTIPSVSINTITDLLQSSAVSGGNVTDDGGLTVTAKGVCWSTDSNPTISDFVTLNGPGTGPFVSSLNNLTVETTYYVRAYATNSKGTAYSNQITFTTPLCASGVYEGDVTLTTQEEVDDFASFCYSKINGRLNIESIDPENGISDLSGLSSLESIDKMLNLYGNHQLINLSGLEGIKDVGNLFISTNQNLSSIEALSNLEELTNVDSFSLFGITVINNNALVSLDGLEKINLAANVSISNNPSLTSIQGLIGLTQVNNSIGIWDNVSLDSIEGLNNLEIVSSSISVGFSLNITSLSPLSNLTSIGDEIAIREVGITNLNGLENVSNIGGNITIVDNPNLINLVGLPIIQTIQGELNIENNSALISLEGIVAESIEGSVAIFDNMSLSSITHLNNLTSIGDFFSISFNSSITSLDGLQNLILVDGNIQIAQNSQLNDLCALTNLFQNGTFTGNLNMAGNAYNPNTTQITNGDCSN